MVARIENVPIEKLKPNPYRNLATYPWNEEKIADLQKSYADVGMWEGIIARPINGHYEIPFAHHRIEAARRSGFKEVPTILRDLTDEQMIRMMAHENSEDFQDRLCCAAEYVGRRYSIPRRKIGRSAGKDRTA